MEHYQTISHLARQKLENHAWLVEFYATLPQDERWKMLRNTVKGMEGGELPESILEEVISTLQFYLNIDPGGGRHKKPPYVIYDSL